MTYDVLFNEASYTFNGLAQNTTYTIEVSTAALLLYFCGPTTSDAMFHRKCIIAMYYCNLSSSSSSYGDTFMSNTW